MEASCVREKGRELRNGLKANRPACHEGQRQKPTLSRRRVVRVTDVRFEIECELVKS